MANPSSPVAAAPLDTLTFRRADGTLQEFFFDDSASTLPTYAASYHRPAPLPRNVMRPYRSENDEPADDVYFLRELRQSFCRDGQDRGRCSVCRQPVHSRTEPPSKSTGGVGVKEHGGVPIPHPPLSPIPSPAYRWFMMSPQRVFRDLVMSDVAEPLPPAVRDALLEAFNQSMPAPEKRQTANAPPLLLSPPPSPTLVLSCPGFEASTRISALSSDLPQPLTEFHYFPRLPYEIRRMIWEEALPFRVLLREDLGHKAYRSLRKVFRPANHTHSIEELWRSDLFYTCVDARRVVEAFARDSQRGSASTGGEERPIAPLMMRVSSHMKLRAGLDVLYYPWIGSDPTRYGGATSGIRERGMASRPGGAAGRYGLGDLGALCSTSVYPDMHSGPYSGNITNSGYGTHGNIHSTRGGNAKSDSSSSWIEKNIIASGNVDAAPIGAVPYGRWASQLRFLRLPISTVALDAAWIDKAHADTVAWAAGVDLSLPDEDGVPGAAAASAQEGSQPLPPRPPPPAAPSSLQLVVADILVPVRIYLDRCATQIQQRLLARHVASQSCSEVNYRQLYAASGDKLVNVNGMDFTVLVDLYDDWRIEEILSLSNNVKGSVGARHLRPLNKAACHRCIACTQRAWEARDWEGKFGSILGPYLRQLCRPTIVFSVVLDFRSREGVSEDDEKGFVDEAMR